MTSTLTLTQTPMPTPTQTQTQTPVPVPTPTTAPGPGPAGLASPDANPLAVTVFGRRLRSPLLNASGSLAPTDAVAAAVDFSGFGAIVGKSVTLRPREGNPPPRTIETPAGLLNSIGLANPGVDVFLERDLPRLLSLDPDVPVVVSIAGDAVDDFLELARRVEAAARSCGPPGVMALEVNASCPNVRSGDAWCASPKLLAVLTGALREVCSLPLVVKLSPNSPDPVDAAAAAQHAGADAVCVGNTFLGCAIDVEARRPFLANVRGGLSGPAIKPLALWQVYRVAASGISVPIIAAGGVASWRDALEFLMAGASLVQIGTGLIRDPRCVASCAAGLRSYCVSHGVTGVSDLVGCAQVPSGVDGPCNRAEGGNVAPKPARGT